MLPVISVIRWHRLLLLLSLVGLGWSGDALAHYVRLGVSPREIREGQTKTFTVQTWRNSSRFILRRKQTGQGADDDQFTTTPSFNGQTVRTDNSGKFTFQMSVPQDDVSEPTSTLTLSIESFYERPFHSHDIPIEIKDDDAPPDISIKQLPAQYHSGPVTEGTPIRFFVQASSAPTSDLPVALAVAETSKGGGGFLAAGNEGFQTVVIKAGQQYATHAVPTTADNVDEPDGEVSVTVHSSSSSRQVSVKVYDDDATMVTLTGPENSIIREGRSATFNVGIGRGLTSNERLEVSLVFSGTATGQDYTLSCTLTAPSTRCGRLIFTGPPDGLSITSVDISIDTVKDWRNEGGGESIRIDLSPDNVRGTGLSGGVKLTDNFGTVTITCRSPQQPTALGGTGSSSVATDETLPPACAGIISPERINVVEGGSASYPVRLASQPTGNVMVDITVGQGSDVSLDKSRLHFTPANWKTDQMVTVRAAQDADQEEGSVTLLHRASGADYLTGFVESEVIVAVADDDGLDLSEVNEDALPDVLRHVVGHTVEALTTRFDGVASGGSNAMLSMEETVTNLASSIFGDGDGLGSSGWEQALSGRRIRLPARSRMLAMDAKEVAAEDSGVFSTISFWGSADYSSYPLEVTQDGIHETSDANTFTVHIGADVQPSPAVVTGLALALSRSGADWHVGDRDTEIKYKVRLNTVHPYVSWSSDALRIWGSLGLGGGHTDLEGEEGKSSSKEGSFTSVAAGARFQLWSAEEMDSPVALALKLDGATASFMDVNVQQSRLAVEATRDVAVERGQLTTGLDLGVQLQDDSRGGGRTAFELGGRVSWSGERLTASGKGRMLFGGEATTEWGIGGSVVYMAGQDGKGMMVSVEPSFGVTSSKLAELWSMTGSPLALGSQEGVQPRLTAELAYGLHQGAALVTPYTDFSVSHGGKLYGIGVRYDLADAIELDLRGATGFGRMVRENRLTLDVTVAF